MSSRRLFAQWLLSRGGAALLGAAAMATPLTAARAALPPRLRLLCGASPGGTPDLIARRLGQVLEPTFPGGVVVDNRPGAGAVLGAVALRQALPDGATWLLGHAGLVTVNPELPGLRLPYEPQRDLLPVAQVTQTPFVLAVGPAVPASVDSLPALLRWWKERPASAHFASPGLGTVPHLLGALLAREAGLPLTHIAFPGGQPAINDVLGGHVGALILPEGLLRPWQPGAGAVTPGLRLLASSAATRSRFLPAVPTFAEQGFQALVGEEWFGCFLPAGASVAVQEAVAARVQQACVQPALAQGLEALSLPVAFAGPQTLGERITQERARWRQVITQAAIRVE